MEATTSDKGPAPKPATNGAPAAAPAATELPGVAPAIDFMEDADPFPEKVIEKLARKVDPALVEVREPNNLLYVPWIHYQEVLLDAFGPAGYRLVPQRPSRTEGNVITWEGALFVRVPGSRKFQFIKASKGECALRGGMTPGNAHEGAQSDCLVKCCKGLGIFRELFDPSWRRWWQREYAPQHARAVQQAQRPDRAPQATVAPKGERSPNAAAGNASSTTAAAPAATAPPAGAAASPDPGIAASDADKSAIRDTVKRLKWTPKYARMWLKRLSGLESVDALSQMQATAVLAMLEDEEAKAK